MDEAHELEALFERGDLIRPSGPGLRLPDLPALMGLADGRGRDVRCEAIPEAAPGAPVVLILADGLGVEGLRQLPAESFLRTHLRTTMTTVFPATTAAALTSLATGTYPAEHGVCGWFLFEPALDLSFLPLPFTDRATDLPLERAGLAPEALFQWESAWNRLAPGEGVAVLPAAIVDSVYSRRSRGTLAGCGYKGIGEAFREAGRHVRAGARFVYLYLPQPDALLHAEGAETPHLRPMLQLIDNLVGHLAESLRGNARILMTADHGLISVPPEQRIIWREGEEPLLSLLRCPPTGEPGVPFFHVRKGCRDAFREAFLRRFGDRFLLLDAATADEHRLFGPGRLGPTARARIGDFVGIARVPVSINFRTRNDRSRPHAGIHGGLRPAEMIVPLIVA